MRQLPHSVKQIMTSTKFKELLQKLKRQNKIQKCSGKYLAYGKTPTDVGYYHLHSYRPAVQCWVRLLNLVFRTASCESEEIKPSLTELLL